MARKSIQLILGTGGALVSETKNWNCDFSAWTTQKRRFNVKNHDGDDEEGGLDSSGNSGCCSGKHCHARLDGSTDLLRLAFILTCMQVSLAQFNIRGWFFVVALFVGFGNVHAADVTLSWRPSSTTNVTGYNIYYGTASGRYTGKIMVGNVTTTTISNLNCGSTYYFSATALDSRGDESDFSNETKFLVPGGIVISTGGSPIVPTPPARAPANSRSTGTKGIPINPMVIKFSVAPAHWYEVQASADFKSWTTIWQTKLSTSNAWVQYSDPFARANSSKFYRLVIH